MYKLLALAGVAEWIVHRPANQRVLGSIPHQAQAWVAGQVPRSGAHERQPHIDISLLLSLPSPLSKNK